ncbi:MAG TPA: SPOR domain-containing protein [Bacteroidales bacterium]|nr:SPOR domain-containing protein [Bacteroidales bacterium]HOM41353.1 SPOR domain-containing protein [Bacteroidales bacterium]HPP93114.1 SPOR domain-containing protein [Bacteroidales bacterium]
MAKGRAYISNICGGCMLLLHRMVFVGALILLFQVNFNIVCAQNEQDYYEILVFCEIPRVGGFELPAVINENEEIFLSVTDLFDYLKVRNIPSQNLDSISGFFINREANYMIDYNASRIRFQDRIYTVSKGHLIRTETGLYLKSDYFGRIFGLECNFNFRSLSVTITSHLELPLIKEMRLEEMRRNLTRLKGEMKADTNLGPTHLFFRFGMADWSVISTQEINGRSDLRTNLNLGAMFAGGDLTANLYYNSNEKFTEKQQYYQWKYVNNDFSLFRQITVGKLSPQSVSTIQNPLLGVRVTNAPTTYRRAFGTYKISDYTEPGWIVELYVNNVLVDYVKSDASGFYTFDVPLVYGSSVVKLKFFGPWGEEKTKEQSINIPYSFLPPGTFEYNVSAGIVEDTLFSRFSRASFNYGLTKYITLGAGYEYLSSVSSGSLMPWVSGIFRPANNILISAEYMHGVRAKGNLIYRLPTGLQLDLNYTLYDKDQQAIIYKYREERKAALALPLRLGKFSTYQRFTLNQIILPLTEYATGEWLFSGNILGINTNVTTYALIPSKSDPFFYSNLSLALRLPGRFVFMPQMQYSYNNNEILSFKARIEKIIGNRMFLNFSYEQNFRNDFRMAEFGLRYDFSFAQTGFSFRLKDKNPMFIEHARGSLISDTRTGYVKADNRPNVGKGGITIIAYLDINGNSGRDPGEPRVKGLGVRASGGRIIKSESDTTIRIIGLEPYTKCFIELDRDEFEEISWRLPVKTISVTVDPDILKTIEVPVSVLGEATGYVSLLEDGLKRGIGKIIMEFLDEEYNLVAKTLSEDDGLFSHLGFKPGKYTVRPDTAQLKKLNFRSEPEMREFIIAAGKEGDFVTDLNFTLTKITPDTTARVPAKVIVEVEKPAKEPEKVEVKPVQPPKVRRDTTFTIVHEVTEEVFTTAEDSYSIQLGAFRRRSNAENYRRQIESLMGRKTEIIIENDLYKVRITGLKDRKEAGDVIAMLNKNGVTELWLIFQKAREQQVRLVERRDTIMEIREVAEEAVVPVMVPEMTIQVGAFRNEKNATALRDKLSKMVGKPVIIVKEEGYHKVRITGFRDKQELENMIPVLKKLGMKDIWVPPVRIPVIEKPVLKEVKPPADTVAVKPELEIKPDTTAVKPIPAVELPKIVSDTAAVKPGAKEAIEKEEVVPPPPKPAFSLHVGEFRKRSQAIRAQKKINKKYGLPVEILMRWDTYHLLITGFYKREDTFWLYPELAGMGYTNIYVVQEK